MRTLPETLTSVDLPAGRVWVDGSGYLSDPNNWSPDFARHAAADEDITLSDTHWQVIAFMRAYLEEHGIAADARFVLKFLATEFDTDKAGSRKILFDLFPYGYVKQACKMAGMKQPRAWSTG